jgi:hypothetical protein
LQCKFVRKRKIRVFRPQAKADSPRTQATPYSIAEALFAPLFGGPLQHN